MASPKIEVAMFYSATTGLPLSGLTPSFTVYHLDTGTSLIGSAPTVTEIGSTGAYKFTPVFADLNRAIIYVLDGGVNAIPRQQTRFMRPEDWNTDSVSGSSTPYVRFQANGDTILPVIVQVTSPKHTEVRVTYSEAVVMTSGANGALRLANYAIAGLTITNIQSLTAQQVLLTTSAQTPNFLYDLTITGVEDLQGNPIA